jgi:ribosome biogenesis GTPase
MNIEKQQDQRLQGVVYKKTKDTYEVLSAGAAVVCVLGGRLRNDLFADHPQAIAYVDPIAIGDEVEYMRLEDGTHRIVDRLPRRSKLSRPEAEKHVFEQVIVANVDQAVPVFAAASPPPKWNLLDRYLVTAEINNLPSVIVINKIDLVQDDPQLMAEVETYRRIGYPVLLVSAVTGEGLAEVRQALQGRLSVLLGKSGVGKSSLLNALQPGLRLRVNAMGAIGKGRHTTTASEMFPLDFGGALVDTPGVREFGLWNVETEDLAYFFPEMRRFIGRCRFGLDCRHNEEPGCAVRKAVLNNLITARRYQSYTKLLEEV